METVSKIILLLAIVAALIVLLPASPVQQMMSEVSDLPYLAEVNWLIPIHKMYVVSLMWLACITAYYAISWIVREFSIVD